MNKLKSKFFAGLVACMMALGLFSSISASAAIVTPIPGSVFQFNI